MILEKDVEARLTLGVEKLGGKCVKFIPDLMPGMPDRLILLPGGTAIWAELKRPVGGRLSELQKYRHKFLRDLGFRVEVVWTKEAADEFLQSLT